MHQAMNNDVVMFVRVNDIEMELEGLREEVEYLVENIEGNANYRRRISNCCRKSISISKWIDFGGG